MSENRAPERLSSISTLWSVVGLAHEGAPEAAQHAKTQLIDRYGKAVYRYILGAVRDAEVADELYQDFALRFVQGKLRGALGSNIRFRYFLKGVLSHMIADHHRQRRAALLPLPAEDWDPADSQEGVEESDRQFLESWREHLLARAWEALAKIEAETSQPLHTVLRYRAKNPKTRSPQMAEQLSESLGKAVSADWVRQTLHRARLRFAELLVDEVAQTLVNPSKEDLDRELADLKLLVYCQPSREER
jgi:RNA polymerase sigma-70 factor (ECF subfamily)